MTDMSIMKLIGKKNHHHGICGFVSAVSAAYEQSPRAKEIYRKKNKHGDIVPDYRKEIDFFLDTCPPNLLVEIERFTRTFEDFEDWSIGSYTRGLITKNKYDISIAMPKDALMQYIKLLGGHPKYVSVSDAIPVGSIIGLGHEEHLDHYIYKSLTGSFINRGKSFETLKVASEGLDILFYIAPGFSDSV